MFKYWRQWWVTNFCQPIYEEWLQEAVLRGRVNAPGLFDDPMIRYAYSWADWTGPSQGQLAPVKEEIMRQEAGFTSTSFDLAKESEGESVEGNSKEQQ